MITRVLVATDLQDATCAFYAARLARELRATLYVLHVRTRGVAPLRSDEIVPDSPSPPDDRLEEKLEGLAAHLREIVPRVRIQQRRGVPWEEILACAEEDCADLVVVHQGMHSAFYRKLLGGTTDRIIHRAPCPVLVAPSQLELSVDPWEGRGDPIDLEGGQFGVPSPS